MIKVLKINVNICDKSSSYEHFLNTSCVPDIAFMQNTWGRYYNSDFTDKIDGGLGRLITCPKLALSR